MLLFLHLPKTGGTTVTKQLTSLTNYYFQSNTALLYGTDVQYSNLGYLKNSRYHLIAGHLNPHHLSLVDQYYSNKTILKTVREPFSRFKSTLKHVWNQRNFPKASHYPQFESRLKLIYDLINSQDDHTLLEKAMYLYYQRDLPTILDQSNLSLAWRAFSHQFSKSLYKYRTDFVLPISDIDDFIVKTDQVMGEYSQKNIHKRINVSKLGLFEEFIGEVALQHLQSIHFDLYQDEYIYYDLTLKQSPNVLESAPFQAMLSALCTL